MNLFDEVNGRYQVPILKMDVLDQLERVFI